MLIDRVLIDHHTTHLTFPKISNTVSLVDLYVVGGEPTIAIWTRYEWLLAAVYAAVVASYLHFFYMLF